MSNMRVSLHHCDDAPPSLGRRSKPGERISGTFVAPNSDRHRALLHSATDSDGVAGLTFAWSPLAPRWIWLPDGRSSTVDRPEHRRACSGSIGRRFMARRAVAFYEVAARLAPDLDRSDSPRHHPFARFEHRAIGYHQALGVPTGADYGTRNVGTDHHAGRRLRRLFVRGSRGKARQRSHRVA